MQVQTVLSFMYLRTDDSGQVFFFFFLIFLQYLDTTKKTLTVSFCFFRVMLKFSVDVVNELRCCGKVVQV